MASPFLNFALRHSRLPKNTISMKFFFKTYNLYKTVHFGYKAASVLKVLPCPLYHKMVPHRYECYQPTSPFSFYQNIQVGYLCVLTYSILSTSEWVYNNMRRSVCKVKYKIIFSQKINTDICFVVFCWFQNIWFGFFQAAQHRQIQLHHSTTAAFLFTALD